MKHCSAMALIITILITTSISMLMLGWWHRSSLAYDVVIARETFYKNLHVAETAFALGIAHVTGYFDDFLITCQKDVYTFERIFSGQCVTIKVVASPQPASLRIVATVKEEEKERCSIQALLVRRDAKPRYFIQYYTLSTAL